MAKYYLTTAIDYVNSLPHIGTAYEKIGADILARFLRMDGHLVHFEMGTDEHSVNVKKAALAQNKTPKAYCDEMAGRFESVWKSLDITYDDFIRTTEQRHIQGVKKLFQVIYEKGDIYKANYEGLYCESCEAFYHEKDLENGNCRFHPGKPLKTIQEENYFFALSRYAEPLLTHIQENPTCIMPEVRRNEIIRLIKEGLKDISISRAGEDWGIALPIDPSHVIYVWFDALINYITAVGYGWDEARFQSMWPAELHIIGKDITRFHCVIWPAMLMSAGLPVPKTVFGHGFVYHRGERISKTLGNVINPLDIVNQFGPDPLRYFLVREASFGKDTDFTWETFIDRYNNDLGNDLGNLLQRTLSMIMRYQGGVIFKPASFDAMPGTLFPRIQEAMATILPKLRLALDPIQKDVDFHVALQEIWGIISLGNRYLDEAAPWSLDKAGKTQARIAVLYTIVELLRSVAILIAPFLPKSAQLIWRQIGMEAISNFSGITFEHLGAWGQIPHGLNVQLEGSLFPRIEPKEEKTDSPALQNIPQKDPKMPATPQKSEESPKISLEDVRKMDLRVGIVVSASKVEKTDKLLHLHVDLGTETRQLVAGIAQSYTPESLIGKRVVVVANLQPAKIRGIPSEGMILVAQGQNLSLLTVSDDVPPGAKIS